MKLRESLLFVFQYWIIPRHAFLELSHPVLRVPHVFLFCPQHERSLLSVHIEPALIPPFHSQLLRLLGSALVVMEANRFHFSHVYHFLRLCFLFILVQSQFIIIQHRITLIPLGEDRLLLLFHKATFLKDRFKLLDRRGRRRLLLLFVLTHMENLALMVHLGL